MIWYGLELHMLKHREMLDEADRHRLYNEIKGGDSSSRLRLRGVIPFTPYRKTTDENASK